MNTSENKVLKGAFFLTVSTILVKIMGVIYKVPLSYILTDEGMGYFNSAYTIYTFFYIVSSAGIPKAISILVSDSLGAGNPQRSYDIYSTSIKCFSIIGLILTLLFFALSKPISIYLGSKKTLYSLVAIAPSVFFVCAASVMRGYLTGRLSLIPVAISEFISTAGRLVFGLAFAYTARIYSKDMMIISAATILGTTLGAIVSYFYLLIVTKNAAEHNVKSVKSYSLSTFKSVLKISLPLTSSALLANIGGIFDLAIIMKQLGKIGYTEYQTSVLYGNYTTLSLPMLNAVSALLNPIAMLIVPLMHSGRNNKILKEVSLFYKISIIFAAPVSMILFAQPLEILKLVFEDTSAVLAAPTLCLLSPAIFLMCLTLLFNSLLEGEGNVRAPLISLSIALVVKTAASYVFIRYTSLELMALPLSAIISYATSFLISWSFLSRNSLFPRLKPISTILIIIATTCSAYVVSFPLLKLINVNNFILSSIVFAVLYLIFTYNVLFTRDDKGMFLSKLTKKQ